MKIFKFFFMAILGMAIITSAANAQNYKASKIDASGKVTNPEGIHIGWVTKEGVIKDTSGNKVGYIDSEGNLLDGKSGKKMGKAGKNGNFVSEATNTPDKGWTVADPKDGTCLVKDSKGNIIGEVHENYKAQGACAIHCLNKKKK